MLSSARSQATDGSGHQVVTEGQGMSQDLGAGPGGKQGPCTAEQVVAPKGGQRAARWQSYDPALLVVAPEQGRCRGIGTEGRKFYLSTIRSRCRFFCLSWLFLLACNLRLAWLLSSWAVRAPVVTEKQSYQQDS